jgi:hypothetical protein
VNAPAPGVDLTTANHQGLAGDINYNRQSGLSCGVDMCLFNGTTWKNLYSGAAY